MDNGLEYLKTIDKLILLQKDKTTTIDICNEINTLSIKISMHLKSLTTIPMYLTNQLMDPYQVKFSLSKNYLWLLGYDHPDQLDDNHGLPLKTKAYGFIRNVWKLFKTSAVKLQPSQSRGLSHPSIDPTDDKLESYLVSQQCSDDRTLPYYLIHYWQQKSSYSELYMMAHSLINIPSFSQPCINFISPKSLLSTLPVESRSLFTIRHMVSIRHQQQL